MNKIFSIILLALAISNPLSVRAMEKSNLPEEVIKQEFFSAISENKIDRLRELLQSYPSLFANAMFSPSWSASIDACRRKRPSKPIDALLTAGANINFPMILVKLL